MKPVSIELSKKSTHWKDRAAGFHMWKITLPLCPRCQRKNAIMTLAGTKGQIDHFLSNHEDRICCDRCDK